jgi:hypothetical protein
VGWQDRRRLPLCAGGSRVRARLYALIKAIPETQPRVLRVSPFAHHRLRQCAGMSPWRCGDGQVERLASGHEDVLWAVVVERFAGESAVESFQPQARDVEEPQPFVFGCPPE